MCCRLNVEPADCISSQAYSISVHASIPHVPHQGMMSLQDGSGYVQLAYREAHCSYKNDKDRCDTWVLC
jgi:hypothetical protein